MQRAKLHKCFVQVTEKMGAENPKPGAAEQLPQQGLHWRILCSVTATPSESEHHIKQVSMQEEEIRSIVGQSTFCRTLQQHKHEKAESKYTHYYKSFLFHIDLAGIILHLRSCGQKKKLSVTRGQSVGSSHRAYLETSGKHFEKKRKAFVFYSLDLCVQLSAGVFHVHT